MKEKLASFRLKLLEKALNKYRPSLIFSIREEIDKRLTKEYDSEIENLHLELDITKRDLTSAIKSRDYYKTKYEATLEIQDKVQEKLINKVEQSGAQKGQLKQEVKQLKNEVAELQQEDTSQEG